MEQDSPVITEACSEHPDAPGCRLARKALFGFVLTFIISRALVFLIMSGRIPNLFLFLRGTHVHHLNYGIFLLAAVAGYVLFARPEGRRLEWAALIYGLALGLTFDEFGMWLHLGGSYWQRASVDAVIVVAALIGLVAYAPSIKRFESHHFFGFIILVVAIGGFVWVMFLAGSRLGDKYGPALQKIEDSSSP
ncbi:MAG: hypothetical protein C5B50_04355 [Verrucomicrobia bacterium]|nr:MAG: hypothetical protein C5B50_04355 [Verrucomicrobiota bacterium]